MPRRAGERRREEVTRFLREITPTPPIISRHREDVRQSDRWEKEQHTRQRSRSPRGDRNRGRSSPNRPRFESPPREILIRRSRSRERTKTRRESPPSESKYLNDRFSDRPSVNWTDPSQDIMSATIGFPTSQHYQNSPTSESIVEHPVIPEFNPEASKLNSKEWLQLLESTASDRGWKQDEKLYIMTSRLAGFARQWYLTTGINCKSWSELKSAFSKAFPAQSDYHTLLTKMLSRVQEDSESLSAYFLHKVALLNECQIQGVKAVSCIIAGLLSSKIQQQVKMQKCEDPDQLFLSLRSLNQDDSGTSKQTNKKEDISKKQARWGEKSKNKNESKKDCYFCGNSGHIVANCQFMKKHKCSVCHQVGHECQPLYLEDAMKKPVPQHNQVMEGVLSRNDVNPKNFTDAYIGDIILKCYVDFESECITIKEESAIRARLPIMKLYKMIRGFANSTVQCVGFIDTHLCIDRAIANVRMYVVPDNIQSIPVVVGQAFTQQAHVVILKDAGKTRFYQRTDNGETNFDF